jgi:hypothetical protein
MSQRAHRMNVRKTLISVQAILKNLNLNRNRKRRSLVIIKIPRSGDNKEN